MPIQRIAPQLGQESVWDYPRPPRLEPSDSHIQVIWAGETIVETHSAYRVLETSHPPTFYIPPTDVRPEVLQPSARRTFCEFKGSASYWHLSSGDRRDPDVAWSYENPTPDFEAIRGFLCFYPSRMDQCLVDGEIVQSQAGDFYGGWITSKIVGPFKGEPGTWGW